MSQTSYSVNQPVAFAGLKANAQFDKVESFLAEGAIDFGLGLVKGTSNDQVKVPILNVSILSIDADLITSNSTVATVNGNSTTATVFATDHDTTMAAIAAKIALLDDVVSAVVTPGARDITITGTNSVIITASAVTTAGASQGTWTQAQSSGDVFRGISIHQHVEKAFLTGVAQYLDEDAVSTLRQGEVWMRQEDSDVGTLAVDDAVYVNAQIGGAQIGRVTSVSTGNVLIPTGVCRELSTDPDGNGIARIDINIP